MYNGGAYVGVGRSLSGRGPEAAVYPAQDLFLAPGSSPIFGADALRFRRSDPTSTNTQITAQASLDEELPRDTSVAGVYVPNYLVLERDGRVSADFSGIIRALGVTFPTATGGVQVPENRVAWKNPTTGFEDQQIIAVTNPTFTGGILRTNRPNGRWGAGLQILVSESTPQAAVQTFHMENGLSRLTTIQDVNGYSDYLQWALGTNPYKVDFGTRSINVAAGPNTYPFSLNVTFQRTHILCIAVPISAQNFAGIANYYGSIPTSLNGAAIVMNSTIAQTITVGYISIGW